MKRTACALGALLILALAGCSKAPPPAASGDVTAITAKKNAEFAKTLNLADQQDFEDAKRGFIARPSGKILAADGTVLKDFDAYAFLSGPAPASVNPSLWRHAQLNANSGLFKVTEGIYQLRGFDLANMTLIEGKTGWIVVDPLTAKESARAALAFARQHLGQKRVSAIVFTHSHADHFGGALGVATPDEAAKFPVVAPEGFMEEATSENILVGTAMARRSRYQFGKDLEHSARGLVDTGLGKDVVYGAVGILPPNRIISKASEELELDGVRFVFHNVPGAEAPAELCFELPELKAFDSAEIVVQTMHNLLPLRGSKVRDALRWSQYLDRMLEQSAHAEVLFGQHTWPVWGHARIADLITKHRDTYRYLHDQTVRLMNAGYTPDEIAAKIVLPKSLQSSFGSRGYYGDLRHNVRAITQFYLGFYDGNPAHLDPLPPEDAAKRYVDLIGGSQKVIAAAQAAFDKGEYRWTAELLNHVVFAQGGNSEAKALLARTYDQLGYAAESATWRNAYLIGAQELRGGPPKKGLDRSLVRDMLEQTPIERFLEAMAAGLDGPAAEGSDIKVNLVFSDLKASWVLWIENAVLHYRQAAPAADANATLTLTHEIFIRMMTGTAGVKDTLMSDDLHVTGSRIELVRFFALIDKAPGTYAIVTP